MQARPNMTLFRRAWDLFRTRLPRKCLGARRRKVYICCHSGIALLDKCRVPHALTDLMLTRARMLGWPAPEQHGRNATVHCLSGKEDLTPPRLTASQMSPARSYPGRQDPPTDPSLYIGTLLHVVYAETLLSIHKDISEDGSTSTKFKFSL